MRVLPPLPRRADARAGFTVIELMVVLVMLGILTAVGLPRLDWTRMRVNSEVRNVVMHLAYAQRLAVSLQHNVEVTIDPATRQIRSHEDRNNDGAFTANERVGTITLESGVNFTRNGAPDLPAPSPTTELTRIIFRRDGSASEAGVIFINSVRGVANSSTTDVRAVEVVRATGRAEWWTYVGGTWKRGGS